MPRLTAAGQNLTRTPTDNLISCLRRSGNQTLLLLPPHAAYACCKTLVPEDAPEEHT
jgi:hypothetical protein